MGPLIDRAAEQRVLEQLLLDAGSDDGRAVVVAGPAGIGKTALLEWFGARATAGGARVLTVAAAQASEEPYATIRGLLAPSLEGASTAERRRLLAGAAAGAGLLLEDAAAREEPLELTGAAAAACRSVFWLTVNLAAGAPLVLCCDDGQWADPASLRVLEYLAGAIPGTSVVLLVGVREGADRVALPVPGEVIRPARLSVDAVATILAAGGIAAGPGLAQAALTATEGVPLMVHELARALAGRRVRSEVVRRDGARLAGDRARDALVGLAADALGLAQAAAVLGRPRPDELVMALAGLDRTRAAAARRALESAGLVRPGSALQLAHPLVTAAALGLLGGEESSRMELVAARLLEQAGEDGSPHLLRARPAPPYAWGRAVLTRRGRGALAAGAPEAAAGALRAALAWHPSVEERESLSLAAARAEMRSGSPDGVAGLLAASREARDGGVRAAAALELASVLPLFGRDVEALEVLEQTAASLQESERGLTAELEASWLFNATFRPELAPHAHDLARRRLAAGPPMGARERLRLGTIAFLLCAQGREPASMTSALARTALSGGQLFDEVGVESPLPILPAITLAWGDCSEEVAAAFRVGLARAERVGSVLGFCMLRGSAADTHFRRGALHESEADARAALETLTAAGLVFLLPPVISSLVQVLMERGDLQEADALLEGHGLAAALPDAGASTLLLIHRGELRFAQGRSADAVTDLRQCGERADRGHPTVPSIVPWRSSLARVLYAAGERREAAVLIREEIDLARAHGAPRAIGHALRIAGAQAQGGGERLLEEAIEVLDNTSAVLERAHATYALGRLRLDRGEPREARDPLREALDQAHSCGALALSARARAALIASGARPRRPSLTGPDALTATERRISGLAAEGMTNAEIAQSQFTTLKTVEKHLTNTFRKLGIDSRQDLAPPA